jgi:soluble lytic murein transglycosylase-like protein
MTILRHRRAIGAYLYVLSAALLLQTVSPAWADCIDDAAAYQSVNPTLVRAIIATESGFNPVARNVNSNGSEDIGLMQINSSWLPALRRYGISRSSLFDACVNAYVGTWILAQNIARHGLTWSAVGAYNANSPMLRLRYAAKIYRALGEAGALPNVVNGPLHHVPSDSLLMPRSKQTGVVPPAPQNTASGVSFSSAQSDLVNRSEAR